MKKEKNAMKYTRKALISVVFKHIFKKKRKKIKMPSLTLIKGTKLDDIFLWGICLPAVIIGWLWYSYFWVAVLLMIVIAVSLIGGGSYFLTASKIKVKRNNTKLGKVRVIR